MIQGKIDIKRAVSESRRVQFDFYRAGLLYYQTEFGEVFSVPIDDVGDATFNQNEKAIMLMRYMRKWNEAIEKAEWTERDKPLREYLDKTLNDE